MNRIQLNYWNPSWILEFPCKILDLGLKQREIVMYTGYFRRIQ